ncbi:MAG: HlyC/CorC family transporter [Oscillospiraceae bacterium]|nr:HlyC/CorC family transporter [Oscillospiraceae bacterium]
MANLTTNLIIMAVLLIMSAFFSATETAYSSLNRNRLKTMAEKDDKKAILACKLEEKYDKLLSTILIGNNLVNIGMAAIGTVLFTRVYGDIGATISTAVVTVVVLIFGEISPKTLAKEHPERFASSVAPVIRLFIWILTPVNIIFSLWKKLLDKLFKVEEEDKITQDELLMIVDEVEQEGGIDEDESNLLRNAIEFTDLDAEDILTHRVDLEALPITATKEEVAAVFSESRYSRLLIYDGSIDNIVGVIHQKDFYRGTGVTSKKITQIMTAPIFVPKGVKISDLLKMLQKHKSHIAVVSDEYGGTVGIVTMEDILEELVGEIWDEHDEVIELIKQIDENTWRISCQADLDEMYALFDIEEEFDCTSISGWVMDRMERIPEEGDSFDYNNIHVVVTSTDSRRILEIEVTKYPESEENEDGEDD